MVSMMMTKSTIFNYVVFILTLTIRLSEKQTVMVESFHVSNPTTILLHPPRTITNQAKQRTSSSVSSQITTTTILFQDLSSSSSSNNDNTSSTENDGDNSKENSSTIGSKSSNLLQGLLLPKGTCNVDQMSGTELAYIGDVVFELYIRSRHVWPSRRTSDLQNCVVSIVRAEHQSYLLEQLKQNFPLTKDETQVIGRGRNSVTRSKNRRNPAAYQDSTAFEALIGYLYISNQERCGELLHWLNDIVDELDEDG